MLGTSLGDSGPSTSWFVGQRSRKVGREFRSLVGAALANDAGHQRLVGFPGYIACKLVGRKAGSARWIYTHIAAVRSTGQRL